MLHFHIPTLEAPIENSPDWYKNYHNAFYMSQLVNTVLLSYMESFIDMLQKDGLIVFKEKELLEKGGIVKRDENGKEKIYIKEESEIYALDIEDYLKEIIEEFSRKAESMNTFLRYSGVEIVNTSKDSGYMERSINIDLNLIFKSSGSNNWHEIVKGFLNLWEFQFLFSITESTLKEYCYKNELYSNPEEKIVSTRKLIKVIIENNSKMIVQMQENHNFTEKVALDIWDAFTTIRDVYSHTHGIITKEDKKKIERYAKRLRESYEIAFSNLFLMGGSFNVSDLFYKDKIKIGKFYFLSDEELSIFRNFVSEFIYALSCDV